MFKNYEQIMGIKVIVIIIQMDKKKKQKKKIENKERNIKAI